MLVDIKQRKGKVTVAGKSNIHGYLYDEQNRRHAVRHCFIHDRHVNYYDILPYADESIHTKQYLYNMEATEAIEGADYKLTVSIAYMANSIYDMPLKKEPWLHARMLRLVKMEDGKFVQGGTWWVVYIWDTREIVQFVEDKRSWQDRPSTTDRHRYVKAVDNAKPLKDPGKLVPDWAMQKLSRQADLVNEANFPH